MAKKKIRNIKLEHNELKATTIGIFENRKKSSVGIVLILAIFVMFIVFLPEISNMVDEYLHPKATTPVKPKPVTPVPIPDPDGEEEPDLLSKFETSLKIENEDIIVDNFVLDEVNKTLSFKVTNNGDEAVRFEELNYYLELYTSEETLMERVKITGEASIGSGLSISLTKKLKDTTADTLGLVGLVSKTINDYNNVTLNTNEDGSAAMVCTSANEKVTYKFMNQSLKEVTSEVSYMVTQPDYLTNYESNKKLSDTYNSKTGIVSTWFEYSEGYNITTNINLSEASRLYVFNADSFNEGVEPKVVKFEMEAQGFSCK